jgi:hypothetical protein
MYVIAALSRSPHWVWVARDPVCKLILAINVGDRTLAMAQRLVHQLTQVLAPDCAPLFLTDGFGEYLKALVTHYGRWMQPERRDGRHHALAAPDTSDGRRAHGPGVEPERRANVPCAPVAAESDGFRASHG